MGRPRPQIPHNNISAITYYPAEAGCAAVRRLLFECRSRYSSSKPDKGDNRLLEHNGQVRSFSPYPHPEALAEEFVTRGIMHDMTAAPAEMWGIRGPDLVRVATTPEPEILSPLPPLEPRPIVALLQKTPCGGRCCVTTPANGSMHFNNGPHLIN